MANVIVKIKQKHKLGNTRSLYIGEITPSTSYPTGGEPLDLTAALGQYVGPAKPDFVTVSPVGGYLTEYVPSTGKVKFYRDNGTATAAALPEVTAAVDLSASVFAFSAIGPS